MHDIKNTDTEAAKWNFCHFIICTFASLTVTCQDALHETRSISWLAGMANRDRHDTESSFTFCSVSALTSQKNQQRKNFKLSEAVSCHLIKYNATFVSAQGSVHLFMDELSWIVLHLSRGGRRERMHASIFTVIQMASVVW